MEMELERRRRVRLGHKEAQERKRYKRSEDREVRVKRRSSRAETRKEGESMDGREGEGC